MDDIHDKMRRVADSRRAKEPAEQRQKLSEASMLKLINTIRKKCNTIFIGAISKIEQEYANLWGDRKTPEEQEEYERFQRLRTDILNNGNNQLRAIENELKQYVVTWQGYSMHWRKNG